MQNRDKIIKEVSVKLGISQAKIKEVVISQAKIVKKAMRSKEPVSIYIRKVGTFISPAVKTELKKLKASKIYSRPLTKNTPEEEEPLNF